MSSALAKLDQAVILLQSASTLDEISHIRNVAKAAEEYARAEKMGSEAVRYASGIKVLAARKAGEMLRNMKERGERRTGHGYEQVQSESPAGTPTLADLGISRKEAYRWQHIATLPEEKFEKGVADGMSETALARGVIDPPPRRDIPMGSKKRSGLRASYRLQKLADALAGYAAALPTIDLRGEDVSELLDQVDEQLLALRRVIKALRGTNDS